MRRRKLRACVRDPNDAFRTAFLKEMPGFSSGRLTLHEADLNNPGCFDEVFRGCHGVCHVSHVSTYNDQAYVKGVCEHVVASINNAETVTRVIVTHLHPDHVGLAGWLVEEFNVPLYMSRTDYLMCRTLVMDTGLPAPEEGVLFYKAAGFPDDALELYRKRFGGFGAGVYRLPQSYRRMTDGQEIQIGKHRWRVVVGRGHAPEHACLWCPELKVMISGDQILPRISSNVSVFPTEPEANPLQEWLDSCLHLQALVPEETLICPSHNEPFYGVKTRMTQLIEGHEDGMTKILAMCEKPQRAIDVFPALFRTKITSGNFGMATGESLAHLNCMRARGQLKRTRDQHGIDWYQRA